MSTKQNSNFKAFNFHITAPGIISKFEGNKTLLGELGASFGWHNPDDNETVLLQLRH